MADVQHDFSRTAVIPLADLDETVLAAGYGPMTDQAKEALDSEGFTAQGRLLMRSVDVRYSGQEHTVTVSVPDVPASDIAAAIEREFTLLHERQYGHAMVDPIELTTMRLRATGLVEKPTLPERAPRGQGSLVSSGSRSVYLSAEAPAEPYALYSREELMASDEISGPAVISEHTATTVMHAGDHMSVGRYGEMVITVGNITPAGKG
jgi:N-methylhydantoinase A